MDTVLVTRKNINSHIFNLLQQKCSEGVEFSTSTVDRSIGVLVPVTEKKDIARILLAWNGSQNVPRKTDYEIEPWFVRCDFLAGSWRNLCLYGDIPSSLKSKNISVPFSLWGRAIRLSTDNSPKAREYFDIRTVPFTIQKDFFYSVAEEMNFEEAALSSLGLVHSQLCECGNLQFVVFDNETSCIKVQTLTSKLSRILRFVSSWCPDDVPRISRVMKILGKSIGYAGATINNKGVVHWRLYGRPFECKNIEGFLNFLS